MKPFSLYLLALLAALLAGPALAQTVTLTAAPTTGISPLNVTLTWSTTGLTGGSCLASGAWSGSKALSGTQAITGLLGGTQTFTLVCRSATGTATLNWTGPTQNTDNTPISPVVPGALAGFKIFAAPTTAGVATATPIVINDKTATTYTFPSLPAGPYFYAMKAFNTEGVESDFTSQVQNVIVAPSATASASVVVNVKPKPPLVTVVTTAYELRPYGTVFYRFVAVGTVPMGAPCGDSLAGPYARFDGARITQPVTGGIIAARCGPSA